MGYVKPKVAVAERIEVDYRHMSKSLALSILRRKEQKRYLIIQNLQQP